MKRTLAKLVLVGLIIGTPSGAALAGNVAARPNIVLILADDLGYSDIGCFGSEIPTPNIDSLARGGVRFTQFYNQARCCPTRAALLTGRYPHQVGIGDMIDDYAAGTRQAANSPAYQDHLSPGSPTMAEVLRAAGYRTLMCGKWHLGKRPEEWPVRRGFDRSFVLIDGAMNYFGGDSSDEPRTRMALDDQPWTPPREGFYATDAFTDRAIEFLNEAVKGRPARPFFLYLPYNASHWPLQAPAAAIARHKGKYDQGWQVVREARLERMKALGIIPAEQGMAPMDRGGNKAWNQLTEDQRQQWARRMEVYAAQTELLDRAIGRVMGELSRLGVADNTLVMFLSDNGGAAEDPNRGDSSAPLGSRDSYRGYGRPWASVSNTPWRRHKITAYEGGISTPLVARWPAGLPVQAQGTHVHGSAHVTDLLPTLVELAGATNGTLALEGKSILAMLKGGPGDTNRQFCWEHEGNRAIRQGNWKLVATAEQGEWELYDLAVDRTESHNLASRQPELVRVLADEYDRWAARCGVMDHATLTARKAKARAQGE